MAKEKELEITVAEVVDYLKITGQFAPALQEVVKRKVAAEEAKRLGIKVTGPQLQKAADVFRSVSNLSKASDTNRWLKSIGISVDVLEEYLETNILINRLKDALNKKTGKKKYQDSNEIKESIREMIYKEWLEKKLK